MANTKPQLARGRCVFCVVGGIVQDQFGHALSGGCRGGLSVKSGRGFAGLRGDTAAGIVGNKVRQERSKNIVTSDKKCMPKSLAVNCLSLAADYVDNVNKSNSYRAC